jgi:hypothetical protein
MHDKTMEDKYVEQYIKTMGNQYSFASNYWKCNDYLIILIILNLYNFLL